MALVFSATVFAQEEDLEVLPEEGRRELFHDYLIRVVDTLTEQRKADLQQALESVDAMETRQARLREDYLKILGELPEKTPLDPEIKNVIQGDGYTVETVTYQSRPDKHVTANFYYPSNGTGPWPGIIFLVGHYPIGKSVPILQSLCIDLATNGFAVLIVDPICQGEMYQIIKPGTDQLQFVGQSGTMQHTRLDVGAMLAGTSVVAYELWDNHRGIDYLYSRTDVVDTTRIGCTGSSGGGAQATYLSAFDTRIKVAAVNSFIMNEPTLYKTIGPQTGSQNLSNEGLYGIDHPEYITMFAPRPFMILCGEQDFFDIEGTRETYAESQLVYERLGAADQLGYFEWTDGHGYTLEKREAAVRWFRTWFYDDSDSIIEGELTLLSSDTLQVTETGQVFYEYENERVVEQFNDDLSQGYAAGRENFWATQSKDSCLSKVRELIKLEDTPGDAEAETVGTIDRGTYTVEKIKLTAGHLTPVAGLLFVPKDAGTDHQAVLYVDGRGKSFDAGAGAIIEKAYVDSGKIVFAIDVRGFGETTDNPSSNESKHGNREHRNAVISGYVGKTLIGQRVRDINMAKAYLAGRDEVDEEDISIVGIDRAGTAVLHAAALDTTLTGVQLRGWTSTDTSWVSMVRAPTVLHNMTHVVPNALLYYDLPDLAKAIAPRSFAYDRTYDSRLGSVSVSYGELDPPFNSEIFDYRIVEPSRDYVRITPSAYNEYANTTIEGGGDYDRVAADTVVEIRVTAEGAEETIYRFTIPLTNVGIGPAPATGRELLMQNYPNPFENLTTISYELQRAAHVTLRVFNQTAQEVALPVSAYQTADRYEMVFDGSSLETGMYFYQLSLDGMVADVKKMSIIRK